MVRGSAPKTETNVKIRDRLEVRAHPTIVQLQESVDAPWIRESYYVTDDVRAALSKIEAVVARERGAGMFLVGQYGSGKSHFLAYLTQLVRAGALGSGQPDVITVSLLNYPADTRLERIVAEVLGITLVQGDRRQGWSSCMSRHPKGLMLVIDELSEFLRSKPNAWQFNEDIRFLQFMGEWAQTTRFSVLAAMQEAIEHLGGLDEEHFHKIRDRYALRLRLSPAHVRDLIGHSILIKAPDYDADVERLIAQLRSALPNAGVDFGELAAIYPLHPAALALLEEVRDQFSRERGVVEFVSRQLGGDPTHGIEPFLDREWGSLITPDYIVDHFRDVLESQPEFLALSQRLFAWYDKHLHEIFTNPHRRALAERVLRLLVLVHLSPEREALKAQEAASWLLVSVSQIEPERNQLIVAGILERFAIRGRYVRCDGAAYRLDLKDDGARSLERHVSRALATLPKPAIIFEMLAELLDASAVFNPFVLRRDVWQARRFLWHFHERPWSVWLGNEGPASRPPPALCIRLPWGEGAPARRCYTIRPAPIELTPALRELAAMSRVRERPLSPATRQLLEQRMAERLEQLAVKVRDAYGQATVVLPDGKPADGLPLGPAESLDKWLDEHATWALRRLYPAFERVAPTHGPLPDETFRGFMRFAVEQDLCAPHADMAVRVIREAYLVPMGLLKRAGADYKLPDRIEKNELVRQVVALLDHGPTVARLHEHLAGGHHGLVPDQIDILLMWLLVHGELDVVKTDGSESRSMRELFEAFPRPIQYDQVVPAQALTSTQIDALGSICDGLGLRRPQHWTVSAQRRAIAAVDEALQTRVEPLQNLVRSMPDDQAGELREKIGRLLSWCAILSDHDDAPEGTLAALEQFLSAIETPTRLLALLAETGELPQRFERQQREIKRLEHVLRQPGLADRAHRLGPSPGLGAGSKVDAWLERAQASYDAYQQKYRTDHATFWSEGRPTSTLEWTPPAVAQSRHVGLGDALQTLDACGQKVRRLQCTGLSDLTFQSRCACGFDGKQAPIGDAIKQWVALRGRVEQALQRFFGRADIREQVRTWLDCGLERPAETLAYLAGDAPWPVTDHLAAFDEHLSGVAVVRQIDPQGLLEALGERTYTPDDLRAAFERWLSQQDAPRIRLTVSPGTVRASKDDSAGSPPDAPKDDSAGNPPDAPKDDSMTRWCVEQALRFGVPLPRAVPDTGAFAQQVDATSVGEPALARLESLGLAPAIQIRVLELVVNQEIIPGPDTSPLVAAAREIVRPRAPAEPTALADLSASLYAAHPTLVEVAPKRWLDRLDAMACLPCGETRPLIAALDHDSGSGWLLIDCLGLPLLPVTLLILDELLPSWRLTDVDFAEVGEATTTDDFYRRLAGAGVNRAFEKIDAIDRLVHERFVPFCDLVRLASAELVVACRAVKSRLDPARPLLVFADHGFRLGPRGRGWTHGGRSTLERIVPLLRLEPYARR